MQISPAATAKRHRLLAAIVLPHPSDDASILVVSGEETSSVVCAAVALSSGLETEESSSSASSEADSGSVSRVRGGAVSGGSDSVGVVSVGDGSVTASESVDSVFERCARRYSPVIKSVSLHLYAVPTVVKFCCCGSSVGISIPENREELENALKEAEKYEDSILVEKKINGREFTVGILDGEVLPAVEIIPTEGFYDYTNKYQAGKTVELCPAPIDDNLMSILAEQTKLAFDALRLSGYSRFDYIVDKDGKPWCLEANTLPGMTPTSLLPQMAAAVGITYGKLCCKIVDLALKK